MAIQVKDMTFSNLLFVSKEEQYDALMLRNQDSVRSQSLNEKLISDVEHWSWIESLNRSTNQQVWVMKAFNKVFGIGNINKINLTNRTASVGWYIDTALQGSGIGLVMAHYLLCTCFDVLGVQKVEGEVICTNTAALSFNKSLGFKVEGIRRSCLVRHGVRLDVFEVGMLNSEWSLNRAHIEKILSFMRDRFVEC